MNDSHAASTASSEAVDANDPYWSAVSTYQIYPLIEAIKRVLPVDLCELC